MYKSIEWKGGRSSDPWPLFYKAVDWIENKGILKPTTVMIKNPLEESPEVEGCYRPRWERIYIYRHAPRVMELALVHELVHSWQYNGTHFIPGPVASIIPSKGERFNYLSQPWEIEAYWYMNQYSLEFYSQPISQQDEYQKLGSHLPHLVSR